MGIFFGPQGTPRAPQGDAQESPHAGDLGEGRHERFIYKTQSPFEHQRVLPGAKSIPKGEQDHVLELSLFFSI